MSRIFSVVGLVATVVAIALLVAGCESADRAAAERARAEAASIRARSEAETERAIQERESSRLAHQQFLEIVPILVIAVGGLLLAALGGFIVWDIAKTREAARARIGPPARPIPPPAVNVVVLQPPPPGQSRREHWQQLSAACACPPNLTTQDAPSQRAN